MENCKLQRVKLNPDKRAKCLRPHSGTPDITLCRATVRRSQCSSRRSRRQCTRRSSWQRVRNSAYLSFGRARSVAQLQCIISDNLTPRHPVYTISPRFIPFTSSLLFFSLYLFSHLHLLVRSSTSLFSFNNVLFSRASTPQIPQIYTYARPPTSVLAAAPKSEASHNLSTLCDRESQRFRGCTSLRQVLRHIPTMKRAIKIRVLKNWGSASNMPTQLLFYYIFILLHRYFIILI